MDKMNQGNMTEAPIVINRTRTRIVESDFNFTKEMIPEVKSEEFKAYQLHAWEISNRTSYIRRIKMKPGDARV